MPAKIFPCRFIHPRNMLTAHPEAHLKSEAWYVLESDPGARIFKGLRRASRRNSINHLWATARATDS